MEDFVWVGMPDSGAWNSGTMVIPLVVDTLHRDVRGGYKNHDVHAQLLVDLPRQIVCIDGKLVSDAKWVRAPDPRNQLLLEMFLTQTAFALPYALLARAVSPNHVAHSYDGKRGEKCTLCVEGSCYFASTDFKIFATEKGDVHEHGWVRVTLMVDDLYDPTARAVVVFEPLSL